MKKKFNILMAVPEINPFTRTGELSDLGGAVPKVLKDMGNDIRLITPQYRVIDERRYILRDVIRLQDIKVPLGDETVTINVKSSFLPNSKIQVYFIDYRPFFARKGLYNDPESGEPYKDNGERFILFSRSIFQTLSRLQWQPDVIHCHGWQAGLIPFFLKTVYNEDPFFNACSTLLTVYDFDDLGMFSKDCQRYFTPDTAEFDFEKSPINLDGNCSFLKAGIAYADYINTVSDTYLENVLDGCDSAARVFDLIKERKDKFGSVINGVDYTEWDPENDSSIAEAFSAENLEGKEANRKALREELGLTMPDEDPVICIITELEDRKGLELVREGIERIMKQQAGLVVMGRGDREFSDFFEEVGKQWKGRFAFINSFAPSSMHLVVAGSDMVLIPSKYEPCGVTQLYCMRYGTVPIVRFTGGLVDTVIPIKEEMDQGTAFTIKDYSVKGVSEGVEQALKFFHKRDAWAHIQKQCMGQEYTIQKSAEQYMTMYDRCIKK